MNPHSDRDLSRLYRSAAQEEPPSRLDGRILAAARAETLPEVKPGKRFNSVRWQLPLALAAVVTLAVSLTLVVEGELEAPGSDAPTLAPAMRPAITAQSVEPRRPSADVSEAREGPAREHARSASPRARPLSSAPELPQHTGALQSSPVQPSVPSLPGQTERAESRLHERTRMSESPAAASPAPADLAASPMASPDAAVTPVRPPSLVPKPAETAAAAGSTESKKSVRASKATERASSMPEEQRRFAKRERSQADVVTRQAPAVAAAATARADAPGTMASDQEVVAQGQRELTDAAKSPEQWLREIEQLRREGRHDEARVRLEEFRKRFPNHALPPTLK